MTNIKSQEPISQEDMHQYLNFLLSGEVKSEKEAKELKRLSRRTTTTSDVVVINKVLVQALDQKLTQIMDVIQIQGRVLEKLGATEEMFTEAQEEYNKEIEEMRKQLEEARKQNKEELADGEVQE